MKSRLTLLPDERFEALRPELLRRMAQIAETIRPDAFTSLCTPLALRVLQDAFARVGATEGSAWMPDAQHENLVLAYNSGPNAARLVGFRQPLNRGLTSTAYATQQALLENEVYKNQQHDRTLTDRFDQLTYALIAAPLFFLNGCRGVITCVQLMGRNGTVYPPGFDGTHLRVIQTAVAVLGELIDAHLLGITVGWKPLA
ncbi:MAG: GAF domain-containing protein [Verrucomicrobia bacterium]|nr:GAF domain-containing protein [Verrucomicrobiota bacterium]